MTINELLATAFERNPGKRFALNAQKNALAVWSDRLGRWYQVAALAITGEWVSLPYQFLVNGKPIPQQWAEIERMDAK